MKEPTVLDYVKAKLTFWRPTDLSFPGPEEAVAVTQSVHSEMETDEILAPMGGITATAMKVEAVHPAAVALPVHFPWRSSLALVSALAAQITFEPISGAERNAPWLGIGLYLVSALLIVLGIRAGEWQSAPLQPDERTQVGPRIRLNLLLIGVPLAGLTFLVFGNGLFTPFNLLIWAATIAIFIRAFWVPAAKPGQVWRQLRAFSPWPGSFTRWPFYHTNVLAAYEFDHNHATSRPRPILAAGSGRWMNDEVHTRHSLPALTPVSKGPGFWVDVVGSSADVMRPSAVDFSRLIRYFR